MDNKSPSIQRVGDQGSSLGSSTKELCEPEQIISPSGAQSFKSVSKEIRQDHSWDLFQTQIMFYEYEL